MSFNQRHYISSERTVLNKRDRLNYEDIWRTTEAAAVPSNRAHLGSLYRSQSLDLHTESLILSFSLISRINHRVATLYFSLFLCFFLRLCLFTSICIFEWTPRHRRIRLRGRNIISSGRNSGTRRFLPS